MSKFISIGNIPDAINKLWNHTESMFFRMDEKSPIHFIFKTPKESNINNFVYYTSLTLEEYTEIETSTDLNLYTKFMTEKSSKGNLFLIPFDKIIHILKKECMEIDLISGMLVAKHFEEMIGFDLTESSISSIVQQYLLLIE